MHRIALLHTNLLFTIVALAATLAAWGLLAFLRGQVPGEAYRAALWVAALLVAAEGLLGLVLLFGSGRPQRAMHMVYGVIAAASLPLALGAAGRDRRAGGILATTCLWVLAIAIRAWQTGA